MAVDLMPDPAVVDLAAHTAAFVRETVIPVEVAYGGVVPSEDVRVQLQKDARETGVFAPPVSREHGGHGPDMCSRVAA